MFGIQDYEELCCAIRQVHQKYKGPQSKCQCSRTPTYIHDDCTLRCLICTLPSELVTSVHLHSVDIDPYFIVDNLTGQSQRRIIVKAINDLVDAKIAKINAYRQATFKSLPPIQTQTVDCREVLQLQLKGKMEVIEGLESEGFTKMKDSWLIFHQGLKEVQQQGKQLLQKVVKSVQTYLDEMPPQTFIKSPFPKGFQLQHLPTYQLDDQPRSVLSTGPNQWLVGCTTKLIEFAHERRRVLAEGVNIGALAIMQDKTVIGSDYEKKQLFKINQYGSLEYLPQARFKSACQGICVLQNGDILYSEWGEHRIMRTTLYGKHSDVYLSELELQHPAGIVEIHGSLIIANQGTGQVLCLQDYIAVKQTQGLKFNFLTRMCVNGESVVVCDKGNKRLCEIYKEEKRWKSREIRLHGLSLKQPTCVAIDSSANTMIVVDRQTKQLHLLHVIKY